MPDLLVNLLKLPPLDSLLIEMERAGVVIRRAQPFEISRLRTFTEENFSKAWADEITVGFASKPVSVYLASTDGVIVGFGAYECTRRAFFGPMGVAKSVERRGIGKALLVACLWGLREAGYVYGIIGRAGPIDFYQKAVNAVVIPDSDPGIYADRLL